MGTKSDIRNQRGFTLIELMAVLVIMAILFSVAAKKYNLLSDTADFRVLEAGISEINMRETLTWTNMKLSQGGWTHDGDVFSQVNTNLGANYSWNPGPIITGGTLHFESQSIALTRNASTSMSAGKWK
ncbi:MAG: prepilin-type N-terminal cleavage/methylation domain-containing protein [Desulfobacterales bacterium]|jgi:prepilin-type N-terminal cleavage/methylation domain-containing protein